MIDFNTYKELHQKTVLWNFDKDKKIYKPKDGNIPKAPEIYLFPGNIPGFDLRRKKWGENLSLYSFTFSAGD